MSYHNLKKERYEAERANEYRETNKRIQKAVKKAKEDWIGAQCEETGTCLNKNNSKRAYQLVKDLTSENREDPQISRTGLGNVFLKTKRFSADGQNIAQKCTAMRVVDTTQYWTAVSPRTKIYNQSSERKLKVQ